MAWSRAKLELVAEQRLARRAALEPVEQAALAYARWQGLTDEAGIDAEATKRALDSALAKLDDLGPDGWSGIAKLAADLGDTAIVGLMQHSLARSVEQVRAATRTNEATDETDVDLVQPATAKPTKKRNKGLDK